MITGLPEDMFTTVQHRIVLISRDPPKLSVPHGSGHSRCLVHLARDFAKLVCAEVDTSDGGNNMRIENSSFSTREMGKAVAGKSSQFQL
jgi:hypothetical protein